LYNFKEYKPALIEDAGLNMGGKNPQGVSLGLNNRYLTRAGKPWIPVMGEFHFSRCNPEDWRRELCKMKAGGITVVSTYMFWIYHEEQEGVFDFSGANDLGAFVRECRDAGLDVMLRPGPWAHGECRNGGLPDWILNKPYAVREDNPEYLDKVRLFYQKIFDQVQDMLYKDGGNVIGVQLENEYVDNADHLATLKKIAQEVGFDVPYYTVTGWNAAAGAKIPVDEVLPLFGGYCDAPWDQHLETNAPSVHYYFNPMRNDTAIGADQIDQTTADGWQLPYDRYPFAMCELGGGLQNTHHRRYIIEPMDVYAMSLIKIGDGCNLPGYYMYHGGTHQTGALSTFQESRATGYPNDYAILNYDFQAPLSQYGEVRGSYRLLNMLHLFVQEWGDQLAPMEYVPAENEAVFGDSSSLRYCMRTDGGSGFVFVNHYQRRSSLDNVEDVQFNAMGVEFPPVDVEGDVSFLMPFRMKLNGAELEYATAQPLTREGNTWFFAEIPGIPAEYCFDNEECFEIQAGLILSFDTEEGPVRIVTLTWEQAQYLRKLDSGLYLGDNCDLYEENGTVHSAEDGVWSYWKWQDDDFVYHTAGEDFEPAQISFETIDHCPFLPSDEEWQELQMETPRHVTWEKISVTSDRGFVSIPDAGDVTQIYADGKLIADNYYYGKEWRIPAALLYGKDCLLAVSELKDDHYKEY
jgi:hypothetical protein